jgi:hypothetical protein
MATFRRESYCFPVIGLQNEPVDITDCLQIKFYVIVGCWEHVMWHWFSCMFSIQLQIKMNMMLALHKQVINYDACLYGCIFKSQLILKNSLFAVLLQQ